MTTGFALLPRAVYKTPPPHPRRRVSWPSWRPFLCKRCRDLTNISGLDQVPGAEAWLTALPDSLDAVISPDLFRVALRGRLRLTIFVLDTTVYSVATLWTHGDTTLSGEFAEGTR